MLDSPSTMVDSLPTLDGRIAERVRALRAASGLSLEALAARSGVSRSMISLVERGETSATAVVLDKLATGLGVPLASLFDAPYASPSPLARHADQPLWKDPESRYLRRQLSPLGYPAPLRLSEIELPAGARVAFESTAHEPHIHQQIWLLAGKLELSFGKETYALAEGDCLAMSVDRPVVFRNPGRTRARYLVAIVSSAIGRS
ncbi:MAG: helix-turn-helix transcriptional regulator [Planctomycetes bacterium]|nr:helix-turn-helix transcriptional regulator [Planctomycetota bacterium]